MSANAQQPAKPAVKKTKAKAPVDPFEGLESNQISRVKQVQKALVNNSPSVDIILLYLKENKNNVDNTVLSILEAADNHTAWIGQDRPPKKQQQVHSQPSVEERTQSNRGNRSGRREYQPNSDRQGSHPNRQQGVRIPRESNSSQQPHHGRNESQRGPRSIIAPDIQSTPTPVAPPTSDATSATPLEGKPVEQQQQQHGATRRTSAPDSRRPPAKPRTFEKQIEPQNSSETAVTAPTPKPFPTERGSHKKDTSAKEPTKANGSSTQTLAATHVSSDAATAPMAHILTFSVSTKVTNSDVKPKSFLDALKGIKPVNKVPAATVKPNANATESLPATEMHHPDDAIAASMKEGKNNEPTSVLNGRVRGARPNGRGGKGQTNTKQPATSPSNNDTVTLPSGEIKQEPISTSSNQTNTMPQQQQHPSEHSTTTTTSAVPSAPIVAPTTAPQVPEILTKTAPPTRTIALRVPAHVASALHASGVSNTISDTTAFNEQTHDAHGHDGNSMRNRGTRVSSTYADPQKAFQIGQSSERNALLERSHQQQQQQGHDAHDLPSTTNLNDPNTASAALSFLFSNATSGGIARDGNPLSWHFNSEYRSPAIEPLVPKNPYQQQQHHDTWGGKGTDTSNIDTRSTTSSVKSMSDGASQQEKYHNRGAAHANAPPSNEILSGNTLSYGPSTPYASSGAAQQARSSRPSTATPNYHTAQRNVPASNFGPAQRTNMPVSTGVHTHVSNNGGGLPSTNFYIHGTPMDTSSSAPQSQASSHHTHFIPTNSKNTPGSNSSTDGMHHAFASHGYPSTAHRYPINYVANGAAGARTASNTNTNKVTPMNGNQGNASSVLDVPPSSHAWSMYHTIESDANSSALHDGNGYRGGNGFATNPRNNTGKQPQQHTMNSRPSQPAPFTNPFLSGASSNPNSFVNATSNNNNGMGHERVDGGVHAQMFHSAVPVARTSNKPVSPPNRPKHHPYVNMQSSYSVVGDTARQLSESEWNMNQTSYK